MRKKLSKLAATAATTAAREASSGNPAGPRLPLLAKAAADLTTNKKLVQAPYFDPASSRSKADVFNDLNKRNRKKKPSTNFSAKVLRRMKTSTSKKIPSELVAPRTAEASAAEVSGVILSILGESTKEANSIPGGGDLRDIMAIVSYLLAFCDSDRKEELPDLLEAVDITKVSSSNYLSIIFKSLGRLQFENFAEKFILAMKTPGDDEKNVSSFLYDYATSIPNMPIEEVISKFSNLHEQLDVLPSIVSCGMLITLCCNTSKVRAALEVVNLVCQSRLNIPDDFFDPLLHACERSCEFDMVHPIYSVMRRHNLKPKETTFKSMISLCVRMKDFEGAYNILSDAKEIKRMLTASMYNAIMAGYLREKNSGGALMVLKQMEDADVQPDSETYSYLIANCECQEDAFKYRDKMWHAGIEKTKHVYMAFINAFAKLGNFESAKQVVLDHEIKSKFLPEIKSALISALSSNGQISDALHVYDEIKQAGQTVEPKAVISLIEHNQSEGELDRLLQLLEELNASSFWFDGCSRVVLYCVKYNFVNSALELLKKLNDKDKTSACVVMDQVFSQIWETKSTNVDIGLKLLSAIKGDLQLHPSRTSLDFLLSSCVKAGNFHQAQLVWSEYKDAGLSYNVLTFLRMYQALLASGQHWKASRILKKMDKDDPHVKYVIRSCKATFIKPSTT